MSWSGHFRSLQAAQNRNERAARKRQNELKRQQVNLEKMQELERANYEVQVYENYLDILLSIHKDCGNPLDWQLIQSSVPPLEPSKNNALEMVARSNLV